MAPANMVAKVAGLDRKNRISHSPRRPVMPARCHRIAVRRAVAPAELRIGPHVRAVTMQRNM
jgi:hypothetical protein